MGTKAKDTEMQPFHLVTKQNPKRKKKSKEKKKSTLTFSGGQ